MQIKANKVVIIVFQTKHLWDQHCTDTDEEKVTHRGKMIRICTSIAPQFMYFISSKSSEEIESCNRVFQ